MRFSLILLVLICFQLGAQQIPLGTWRSHLSYRDVIDIEKVGNRIYALSTGGLFYYDQDQSSLETLSSVTGLRRENITTIESLNDVFLVIGYKGGQIDLLSENEIISIDDIERSDFIQSSKKINHIFSDGTDFVVSTGFGVVIFNAESLQVDATYWQLDDDGDEIEAYSAVLDGDLIAVATEKGLMYGSRQENLQDFTKWNRDFGIGVANLMGFHNNEIYALIDSEGMFEFNGSGWTEVDFDNASFRSLNEGISALWVCTDTECTKWTNSGNSVVALVSPANEGVGYDAEGVDWIGTEKGLFKVDNSTEEQILPGGPWDNRTWSLEFEGNLILGTSGGFNVIFNPQGQEGSLYAFDQGGWSNYNADLSTSLNTLKDPVDVAWSGDWYVSSYGEGVYLFDGDSFEIFPLPNGASTNISQILGQNGLWILDEASTPSLYHLSGGTWNSYPISAVPPNGRDLIQDNRNIYILTDPTIAGGIILMNRISGQDRLIGTTANEGDLPGTPTAIVIDKKDDLWIGTTNGVAYLPNPDIDQPLNAFTPISNFTPLLRGQAINSIAVDPGNRKWIATDDGVWLMDDRGEEVIQQFNIDNSPLLDNEVQDIAIDGNSGEVFFLTAGGIISYRSDATDIFPISPGTVKIFPNPVMPDFKGIVAIEDLFSDTDVKITDTSGRLIYETRSNGGTASWDLSDLNGNRVSSGVYFVYTASTGGEFTVVGKLAVIR